MRIVDRDNFFCSVCEVFTVLTLGKIIFEAVVQDVFGNYQENLLVMFFLSLAAVFVLSQYYRFQKYPLLVCIVVQYAVLIALVMLITWSAGQFHPLHEDAFRDIFWSFTVPYAIGVVIYYIMVFHEIKRANQNLKKIKEAVGSDKNKTG